MVSLSSKCLKMGGSPSQSRFQTLKLRLHDMKVSGVLGLMSCCCSVEGLCPVEESRLCNLTPGAFWVGPRPVKPLELHPSIGSEKSLVQGPQQQIVWILWIPMDPSGFHAFGGLSMPSLLPGLDQLFAAVFESLASPKQLNFS